MKTEGTVKPKIFMTFSFHDFQELEKFMKLKSHKNCTFFSYLTVKFGVCRAIMGVNITTNVKYYKGPNNLSSTINRNENQSIIKIIYLTNKLYPNYEIIMLTCKTS